MEEKRHLKKFSSILANPLALVSEKIQETEKINMCACMYVILSPHPLDIHPKIF